MSKRKTVPKVACDKCGAENGSGDLRLCPTCRLVFFRVVQYPWTSAMDDQLRAAYRSSTKKQLSQELTRLQSLFRFPRHILQNRAQTLGLSVLDMNPWSDDELDFLEQHAETLSLKKLAARLHRSDASIKQCLFRRGLQGRCREGYSAVELGQLMRVSTLQVATWIRRGLLERSEDLADRITQESVRRLLTYHMEEFSLRRVDERWMKMLVREELKSRGPAPKPVQTVSVDYTIGRRRA